MNTNHMKVATINIPEEYLNCIETLVDLGFYPSRSEVIRESLKKFLNKEENLNTNLKNFKEMKTKQMERIQI